MKKVAILLTSPASTLQQDYITPFQTKMAQLGWTGGSTVEYIVHAPTTHLMEPAQMLAHANKLVKDHPDLDVIWVISTASGEAAVGATTTIPIIGSAVSSVFANGAPRNFAGFVGTSWELGGVRFQRLKQMMPALTHVAVLVNPNSPSSVQELGLIQQAAAQAQPAVTITRVDVHNTNQLNGAFSASRNQGVQAVMTTHVPLFGNTRADILSLAAQSPALPVVGHRRAFAAGGALMSYGSELQPQIDSSAEMVHEVLNGTLVETIADETTQPGDLDWVVKASAAAQFGVPAANYSGADEVIP